MLLLASLAYSVISQHATGENTKTTCAQLFVAVSASGGVSDDVVRHELGKPNCRGIMERQRSLLSVCRAVLYVKRGMNWLNCGQTLAEVQRSGVQIQR